jgi:hypothetical protein
MSSSDPSPARVQISRVQIYGERCSGTNYVAELLKRNFTGLRIVDEFGWKHGWVYGEVEHAADCVFLVVNRDPFDWLRSLHEKPWHAAPELRGVPFSRFIRTPWRCLWGADTDLDRSDPRHGTEMLHERDPQTREPFANAMRLRTAKARAWAALRLRVRHHLAVRYEDVARDPRAFVASFATRWKLTRWPWFRDVKTFKGGREPFRPKRYAAIAPTDLLWIASELDAAFEAARGYELAARVAELSVPLEGAQPGQAQPSQARHG